MNQAFWNGSADKPATRPPAVPLLHLPQCGCSPQQRSRSRAFLLLGWRFHLEDRRCRKFRVDLSHRSVVGSKFTSFVPYVSVITLILRASVRPGIVRHIPLSTRAIKSHDSRRVFPHSRPCRARFSAQKIFLQSYRNVHVLLRPDRVHGSVELKS